MFNFYIDFVKGLDGTEKLSNIPIDGIPLYSTLDRLINCLQGNFASGLYITHEAGIPHYLERIPKDNLKRIPKDKLECLTGSIDPKEKEDFFWLCSKEGQQITKEYPSTDEYLVGEERDINDAQFHILCEAIKKSRTLNFLELLLPISLTEYQEKELIAAITENSSINLIFIMGCISAQALTAINAISDQRPELKISSFLADTSAKSLEEGIQRNQLTLQNALRRRKNDVEKSKPYFNMHLLQGFIAVLGAATVATSLVLLYTTALSPLAFTLLFSEGAAALTWGTYSFFSSYEAKQTKDIQPFNSVLTV